MFDRKLLSALLAGFALIPAVQAAQADAMPGTAPSFRIPRPLYASPTVSGTRAPAKEPQSMLPPPDSPSHASGSVSMQGGNPFDLNSRPRIFNFNSTQGNNAADLNSSDTFRKPDQYTDSPQVDTDGVRHFSNGRHFDLSKTSIQDAIGQTNSSQLGQRKKQQFSPDLQQDMMARKSRRQDFLSRGAMNGGSPYNFNNFDPRHNSYDYSNYGSQSSRAVVTDWRNTPDAARNNQTYSMQQNNGSGFQQGGQLNEYDRQQRRAMRRQARQMQMRNYNF